MTQFVEYFEYLDVEYDEAVDEQLEEEENNDEGDFQSETSLKQLKTNVAPKVRKFFPETWLWDNFLPDSHRLVIYFQQEDCEPPYTSNGETVAEFV